MRLTLPFLYGNKSGTAFPASEVATTIEDKTLNVTIEPSGGSVEILSVVPVALDSHGQPIEALFGDNSW